MVSEMRDESYSQPESWLPFEQPIKELADRIEALRRFGEENGLDVSKPIAELEKRKEEITREIFSNLTPWQRVQTARHPDRPVTSDYIDYMFDDFIELCGDRRFADDRAIITGLAKLKGMKLMFIGHEKGRTTKDRLRCNFGMPHPEGFRKAMLKMKLAEKFKLPIVTFLDTAGAYPGIGAEERGIAQSIAENLMLMADLRTPILSVVIGEGASGGALGIGLADRILMMENSYYSVITPEGCAAILWRSRDYAAEAAAAFKLVPQELIQFGVIDEIIPEPLGGAHRNPREAAERLAEAVRNHLRELKGLSVKELLERRYEKYRRIGVYKEEKAAQAV